jgi:thiamine pyrophosphate-dependent acetolactate synthase large subunit-like protein
VKKDTPTILRWRRTAANNRKPASISAGADAHQEKPRGELTASEADVAEIARRIDKAGSVVIMCGAGCRGAADLLGALSNRLKAPQIVRRWPD